MGTVVVLCDESNAQFSLEVDYIRDEPPPPAGTRAGGSRPEAAPAPAVDRSMLLELEQLRAEKAARERAELEAKIRAELEAEQAARNAAPPAERQERARE